MFPGGGDDDDFGDFEFISSAPNLISHQQEDDDWGDFVATPVQFNVASDPSLDGASDLIRPNTWEKPTGALPLSFFGGEDVEEPEPVVDGISLFGSNGFHPASNVVKDGAGLKDLIASLYGNSGSELREKDGGGFEEDGWEFKEAAWLGAGVQKEDEKSGAAANDIQVGISLGTPILPKEHGEANVLFAPERMPSGFSFASDVIQDHYNTNAFQQNKCFANGNGANHTLEHGDTSADEGDWYFKDALADWKSATASLEQQKNPEAEADVNTLADKSKGTINERENNMNGFAMFIQSNGNKDGQSKDLNELSWEPASLGNDMKNTSSFGIILDFYDNNFKDAFVGSTQSYATNEQESCKTNTFPNTTNDSNDFDDNWEFQAAPTEVFFDNSAVTKADQCLLTEPAENNILNLYSRLKEDAICMVVHHLGNLKKADEDATFYSEQAEAIKLNKEIEVAYEKLKLEKVISSDYKSNHTSTCACGSQLLQAIKEWNFEPFEKEYHLSELISLAEKDLGSAIKLFEHAKLVVDVLESASTETQQAYLMAWTRLSQACAQELNHGATIWKESVHASVWKEIICRGSRYFVALGEINLVTAMLRATLELYKPWVLLHEESSRRIATNLEMCDEAWRSGLGSALQGIAEMVDLADVSMANSLLESIKFVQDLEGLTLHNYNCGRDKHVCTLSLLATEAMPGMKTVTWNGERYSLKFANMWANLVCCHPPELPAIIVG